MDTLKIEKTIEAVYQWSKKERLQIAKTLLVTLFKSIFVFGEIHGDPHNGNYLFRRDKQSKTEIILLDYGSTVLITKPRRLALLKLIDAYRNGSEIVFLTTISRIQKNLDETKSTRHNPGTGLLKTIPQ